MNKTKNILMVGVGGQGIILASNIFSRVLMIEGFDVKKNEIHGMSQRGGSVFSHIRYGEKVNSPVIPRGEAEIIFSLESMEVLRWHEFAAPNASIVYLNNKIKPAMTEVYPEGVDEEITKLSKDIVCLDVKTVTKETGNVKVQNVTLLGALSTRLQLKTESWKQALEELVPAGTFEGNWKAFELGIKLAEQR